MMKHTESSRLMRGAWEVMSEYIFELRTEFSGWISGTECGTPEETVGCDGSCIR